MKLATLVGVDVPSGRFTYELSENDRVWRIAGSYDTDIFEVFSREDFTKIWCRKHTELVKTLGVKSHEHVLEKRGYTRAVHLGFVSYCTDEELLACIYEFEKTGDDLSPFLWQLDLR